MSKDKKTDHLTEVQFFVTQKNGTEKPFENQYWDFFEEGLYLDIVSNEVLFSSKHKFPSNCGWPSFYKTIERSNIIHLEDHSMGMNRVEVRSKTADSHLGHVFTDGPAPTGVRYCINSAALLFVPVNKLSEFGLENYSSHFTKDIERKSETVALDYITLGAGCFWGVEAIFSKTNGIVDAVSGYCGGKTIDPTYEEICTGETGHAEVVQVKFDKEVISIEEILYLFFRLHDPTTLNAQGYDIGTQYRSVIYYHSNEQKEVAQRVLNELNTEKFNGKIVTEITAFPTFYPAEEYHQDYYDKKYNGGFGPICHFVRGE